MAGPLVLVANPGSASRKYALFQGARELASIHIEWVDSELSGIITHEGKQHALEINFASIEQSASHVVDIFTSYGVLSSSTVDAIGLRVVAPGTYFTQDHLVNEKFVDTLRATKARAPLHIRATLQELGILQSQFAATPIYGISDSAFHATKRAEAWHYGIPLDLAERYDIKRFGYHGLSVESVVGQLGSAERLAPRSIICHLGSGASVTAVLHDKSADTTMGYSPLEGLIMSTRSGSVDFTALSALKHACGIDDKTLTHVLNTGSGLLGLGKSADIRHLLAREAGGNMAAKTALDAYVYSVQKGIGQMVAAVGGLDILVFTGTVGERSFILRERITEALGYLDVHIAKAKNNATEQPASLSIISKIAHSKPVLIVPTKESAQIAAHVSAIFTRG